MIDQGVVITSVVVVIAVLFRVAVGGIFKRKLRELVGHQLLANVLTGILSVGLISYLLYIWDIVQALYQVLLTLGAIAVVLMFTLKDIWISNLFAGISLIGDRHVNIGSEVEIEEGGR